MTQKKNSRKAADSRPTLGGRRVHRVVFVTGKGGVGKSVVAAATAMQLARAGKSVLLVELGSRSFYGPLLGLPVGADTVRWTSRIGIARWDVESALREYVAHYLVFKAAADWVLNYTAMKALMAAAPSLAELAILGKLTGPMRHAWYQRDVDVVVVDAYSTGQFMALLRAPRGISQTAASGPMRRHTVAMTALLSEPAICEYRLVTLAEEMPTAEACEMAHDLRAETGIAPRIYCNRLIDLPPHLPAWPPDGRTTGLGLVATAWKQGVKVFLQACYHLRKVIINRAWPQWTQDDAAPRSAVRKSLLTRGERKLAELHAALSDYYAARRSLHTRVTDLLILPEMYEEIAPRWISCAHR